MWTKSKVEDQQNNVIVWKKEHGFNDRSVCHRAKEEHNLGFRFLKHVYLYSLKRNSENTKYKKQNWNHQLFHIWL